mmetsp:Transcript_34141/g.65228  ORF Transcript_34141/g.65228 Transcript_34141/m.65228 type:complete len:543 (-) Transcript_34141:351-1979(-)
MQNALIQARRRNCSMPLNEPGYWDFYISYNRRDARSAESAIKLHATLTTLGQTVWIDENMQDRSEAAAEEGVQNSGCVLVVTAVVGTFLQDVAGGDYPSWLELCWAEQARSFILRVLRTEHSQMELFGLYPTDGDFVYLNHRVARYWAMGVEGIVNSGNKRPRQVVLLKQRNDIEGLIQVVVSPDNAAHRIWAVRAMGDLSLNSDSHMVFMRAGAMEALTAFFASTREAQEKMEAGLVLARLVGVGALEWLVQLLSTGDVSKRSQAAEVLAHLSSSKGNRDLIMCAGAVEPLVHTLSTRDEGAIKHAVKALRVLNCDAVVQPLARLLCSGDAEGKKHAGRVLLNLAHVGGLEPLMQLLNTGDAEDTRVAVEVLADLDWKTDAYKAAATCASAVEATVEGLRTGEVEGQKRMAHQLCMWASNRDNQALIARHGAVEVLVQLLSATDARLRRCVTRALGWLASNHDNKLTIARAGAVEPLLQILSNGDIRGKQEAARVLATLARREDVRAGIAQAGAVAPLQRLLSDGGHQGWRWAAVALHFLA